MDATHGTNGETVLSARSLVIRYGAGRQGGADAVRGIDLQIRRGEVLGLIGPDGAGKTSTLRTLAGLQRATSGEVRALGEDAWQKRRLLHRRLGYLAQRFALYEDLSVDENVQFFSLLLGVRDWRPRRDHLLERVGLLPFRARQAGRLSGGMKQKLALATSLMHAPEILLLDEPTTGVDPVTRREFWRLLSEFVAEGLTLLVATPYLDEAERCSRVVLMHLGRVVADARPQEITASVPGVMLEVVAEPRGKAGELLRSLLPSRSIQPFSTRFHVHYEVRPPEEELRALRAAFEPSGVSLVSLRVISPGLEDAFLHLTRAVEPESREAA